MSIIKKVIAVVIIISVFILPGCENKKEVTEYDESKPFTITFITVGKGDAFLLTMPDGSNYMVDTGKEEDFIQIGRVLKEKKVSELEGIFLSHGHLDHTGSLKGIVNTFDVKKIYMSEKDNISYKKADVKELISGTKTEIQYLKGGETFDLGGVTAHIWIPEITDRENENNNSVVMKLVYGNTSCLMTGDMELEEEMLYLKENKDVKADILKLGHHGETDATSDKMLEKVKPLYGIICGNEEENTESVTSEMKDRLDKYNVNTFYSDPLHISVDFILNGRKIEIEYNDNKEINVESSIKVSDYSRKHGNVTIENSGEEDICISDYIIVSYKERENYVVPDNTTVKSGESLLLDTGKMWKKKDKVLLYDDNFNFINIYDKDD